MRLPLPPAGKRTWPPPSRCTPPLQAQWWLAKAVFRSLDAAYHQLISHWLRCHCCTEPYLIALRRHVSAMHPVGGAATAATPAFPAACRQLRSAGPAPPPPPLRTQ
jgi:hypothetical protein